MAEERIVERNDGVTAERVTERNAGGTTTVVERRGGGGGLILGIIALIIVVVGAFYFLSYRGSEARKDDAIAEAARSVGDTAERAGDAIDKAVPTETK